MGWNFQLYRTDSPLPPMQWEDNLAEPIGTSEAVAAGLGEMLPIEWRATDEFALWATVRDPQGGEAFDVVGYEFEPGIVGMLSVGHRAPPAVLAALMDRFGLDHCCTEHGDFRDPHRSDEDWNPPAAG